MRPPARRKKSCVAWRERAEIGSRPARRALAIVVPSTTAPAASELPSRPSDDAARKTIPSIPSSATAAASASSRLRPPRPPRAARLPSVTVASPPARSTEPGAQPSGRRGEPCPGFPRLPGNLASQQMRAQSVPRRFVPGRRADPSGCGPRPPRDPSACPGSSAPTRREKGRLPGTSERISVTRRALRLTAQPAAFHGGQRRAKPIESDDGRAGSGQTRNLAPLLRKAQPRAGQAEERGGAAGDRGTG